MESTRSSALAWHRPTAWLAVTTASIFVFTTSARPPDIRYTVTPVGAGIGQYPTGAAVNNRGEVLLTVYDGQFHPHSYLWKSGQATPVPSPSGARVSYAVGLNDQGQVAVAAEFGTGQDYSKHGYILESGVLRELAAPPGSAYVSLHAINNRGQVAGIYAPTVPVSGGLSLKEYRPTVWATDGHTDMAIPGDPFSRAANGINDSGTVVGWYGDQSEGNFAYRWLDGVLTRLPGPSWAGFIDANDINNAGQIVGTGTQVVGYSLIDRPLLWNGDIPVELPLPAGYQGGAFAINDSGLVIGTSTALDPADSRLLPWIWDGQGVHDLNSLISPQSGWQLASVAALNDLGWITGTGLLNGVPTAFLLTPVPAPAGAAVLIGFAFAMATARRRRK